MKHFSDQEILQAIRQGQDTEVIKSLYVNLLPKVKKHVLANSGSLEDAYDVFQDGVMVFYKLVVTGKFDDDKYSIHGFVFTICKNLWINLVKKRASTQNREQNVEKDAFDQSVLENIIDTERAEALHQVFQSLGDKCTEIMTLFFYHRLSLKEIAEKLGDMSEDAVKVKNHRCKKMLTDKIRNNKQLIELLRN